MQLVYSILTIAKLLDSPIYNFVALAENDCSCEGTTEDLIVNYLHLLFLKSKVAASKADNPNLHQSMDGQFSDEYWESAVTEIETL